MSKRKPLSDTDISTRLNSMPGWTRENNFLRREFSFPDFRAAFAFMTRIAFEAEIMNHHPAWTNVYNKVLMRLNTHDAGGITELDFELAQKTENIFKNGF